MDIRESEKLVESFKKKPLITILSIVISVLLLSLVAWSNAFWGEKGKQAAKPPKENPHLTEPSKKLIDRPKPERPSTVKQRTEGDQSPIVNVGPGGESTINYVEPKGRGASE